MSSSNQNPPERTRLNYQSERSSGSRDIYSNNSDTEIITKNRESDDTHDIYTQNREILSNRPKATEPEQPKQKVVPPKKKKKRKGRIVRRVIFSVFAIVLAAVLVFELWGKDWINSSIIGTTSFTDDDEALGILESGIDTTGVTNIALFGLDTRSDDEEAGNRSDSIMILTIDKNHGKIKVSSIMRDSAVNISGYGLSKINAAYNYGGAELAVKTLNEQLSLNIREYATVDFANMAAIIDAVGGIDLEVTELERAHLNGSIVEQCEIEGIEDYMSYFLAESGYVHMNGMQAVAYARIRYVATSDGETSDYGRTERQRIVMEKLFEKAIAMNKLTLISTATTLIQYVETSLDIDDILSLAGVLLRSGVSFEQARYPRTEDLVGDGDIWISSSEVALDVDWDSIRESIQAFIYDDIALEDQ